MDEYLYGAVSLDFRRVRAPVRWDAGDTITPAPTSTDSVRPGVLVSRSNGGTVILIGTLSNVRGPENWLVLDGPGIGLVVRQISRDEFAGTWRPWGNVLAGEGFFCAVRTSA